MRTTSRLWIQVSQSTVLCHARILPAAVFNARDRMVDGKNVMPFEAFEWQHVRVLDFLRDDLTLLIDPCVSDVGSLNTNHR